MSAPKPLNPRAPAPQYACTRACCLLFFFFLANPFPPATSTTAQATGDLAAHQPPPPDEPANQSYEFIWKYCSPPRIKFFDWLLLQQKIQCKTSLVKKHFLEDDTCELCGQMPESSDHIRYSSLYTVTR